MKLSVCAHDDIPLIWFSFFLSSPNLVSKSHRMHLNHLPKRVLVNLRNFRKKFKCMGKHPVIAQIKARVLLVMKTFHSMKLDMAKKATLKLFLVYFKNFHFGLAYTLPAWPCVGRFGLLSITFGDFFFFFLFPMSSISLSSENWPLTWTIFLLNYVPKGSSCSMSSLFTWFSDFQISRTYQCNNR